MSICNSADKRVGSRQHSILAADWVGNKKAHSFEYACVRDRSRMAETTGSVHDSPTVCRNAPNKRIYILYVPSEFRNFAAN